MVRKPTLPNPASSQQAIGIAVAALLKRDSAGVRVLICKRLAHAIRGGLWEFPGGKIPPMETPAQAGAREVREETGLHVESGSALPICELLHHEPDEPADPSLHFHLMAFWVSTDASAQPLAASECKWETLDALDAYEWPKANTTLIRRLREWMRVQAGQPTAS
jgi:8-oxo-dGTP diphosphatase